MRNELNRFVTSRNQTAASIVINRKIQSLSVFVEQIQRPDIECAAGQVNARRGLGLKNHFGVGDQSLRIRLEIFLKKLTKLSPAFR